MKLSRAQAPPSHPFGLPLRESVRWRSTHHSPPLKIAIVGGGIASLVAGITLREALPNAAITLYTATGEAMIGGQLASWDENGYPVEHGLHALFGFYDHILPILSKVGAHANLTRSKEHIFIHERGAIHRFDLRTWLASYRGFTTAQKLQLLAAAPAIGKLVLDVKRKGLGVFDAYDQFDLRALARMHGVPSSVLHSGFFRQFYEAAFNAPSELSAAVALESIYKIFTKRWHYYFNLPTTESIITPLRHYFTNYCHGNIEFNQKLTRVRTDDVRVRVLGLDFENVVTRDHTSVKADEYVLAIGLEDFKQVNFGTLASQHSYFRNVHKLQTVSSFSIQAWFKDDPVPQGIDSMVTGMPAPFGILCPITRVRALQPPSRLPLRHEVIATGPERGYEDIPDQAIKAGFIKGLRDAGFSIPDDPMHMHVVLRRNRESFHRYLLTRPGELLWRPPHQSPFENLCLAGAWVRNEFALPCVDAAAQGAIKVAALIAARALASRNNMTAQRFAQMPRSAPLVPPPYHFPRSTAALFLLDVHPKRLADAIAPDLKLLPGLGSRILFAVLRHEDVYAQSDPSGARYDYNEVLFAAFVREKGLNPIGNIGLYPICLYVDDETAMAAGREIYGFPKRMARIELRAHEIGVAHCSVSPRVALGSVQSVKVMSSHWAANPQARVSSAELPSRRARKAMATLPFTVPLLRKLARLVNFYNTRHMKAPGLRQCVSPMLSQLTKVALQDVEVRRVSALRDCRLRLDPSGNDPIHLLMPAGSQSTEIHAGWGMNIELAFSMDTARAAGGVQAARAIHAPGPALERRSGLCSRGAAHERKLTASGASERA